MYASRPNSTKFIGGMGDPGRFMAALAIVPPKERIVSSKEKGPRHG
jgi:hypothetical protein